MRKYEIFARNLTKSGYGFDYEIILKILNKLTDKEVDKLAFNCYMTSEKLGKYAFDCDVLFE